MRNMAFKRIFKGKTIELMTPACIFNETFKPLSNIMELNGMKIVSIKYIFRYTVA